MDKIQIKCTSCGQLFEVTESYIGRMVECGACDEKFKVEASTIMENKKKYPGQKSESNAEIYTKSTPPNPTQAQDITFQTASYQNVSAEYAQPPRPLKTLIICIGAISILAVIVLFLIGGSEGGILKGLSNSKRLILAGFVSLAGSSLIIIGARHKFKGLIFSLVLSGSLMAMPFLFPEVLEAKLAKKNIWEPATPHSADTDPIVDTTSFEDKLAKYKKDIGFKKVAQARKALENPDHLKAIVIRNEPDKRFQDLDPILSCLQYSIGLKVAPVTYSYGREINGEPVILVTFITETPIEQIFEITKKFGVPQEMDKIKTTLKVIEVIVDRNTLISPPSEIINDESHPNYYLANYIVLIGIDRDKQLNAAKRLQNLKIKGKQADIADALENLISVNDHELSSQVIATLYHWTLPEYKTDQKVLEYAKKIAGTNHMHSSVMNYLADKDVSGAEEVLAKQWLSPKGSLLWGNHLIRAKKRGEKAVINSLPNLPQTHHKSAAFILSKVGTPESIDAINEILPKVNESEKKYFKAAIDEIKSRQ